MKFFLLSLYLSLVTLIVNSQSKSIYGTDNYFIAPVDIPMYLSGNFGELRSTHFHAGIDIKTQTVVGKNILAAADGYISRIKIQTLGYGRSIYISHPNGLTTVYAHLLVFAPEIEEYIKQYQYRNKTHTLDLYLEKNQFLVKQGQLIALSGNSGSSGGPHLHFEIRETSTQEPMNGLQFGFDIKDNIAPSIRGITIYPLSDKALLNNKNSTQRFDATGGNGKYVLNGNPKILLNGNIGFSIEVYDYLNGSNNRCGIFSIEMLLDGQQKYIHTVDQFSFAESGYIKSHIDYEEKLRNGRTFQKTFKDPNNNLSLYKKVMDENGLLFDDDTAHWVEFIVHDTYGNISKLGFEVMGSSQMNLSLVHAEDTVKKHTALFKYNQLNIFGNDSVKVEIPKGSLYRDLPFNYSKTHNTKAKFSGVHHIHDYYTPMHQRMNLSIKTENFPEKYASKAVLIYTDEDNDISALPAHFSKGWVSAGPRKFGPYYVGIDTTGPQIIPLNIYPGAKMTDIDTIRFKVTDDLTDIYKYEGYIDNQWALFEYDPKNDLMEYVLDKKRISTGKNHDLELILTDECDNVSIFHVRFYY